MAVVGTGVLHTAAANGNIIQSVVPGNLASLGSLTFTDGSTDTTSTAFATSISDFNPHIGDEQVVTLAAGQYLAAGDRIVLYDAVNPQAAATEAYEGIINSYNTSTGAADFVLDAVLDPFTAEAEHSTATAGASVINFSFGTATSPSGDIPTVDLDDEEIVTVEIIAADGSILTIRRDGVDDTSTDAGTDLAAIGYQASTTNFQLRYTDNTAAVAAGNAIASHGGSDFDVRFSYHDHQTVTHYKFTKDILVYSGKNARAYAGGTEYVGLPIHLTNAVHHVTPGENISFINLS